MNLTMQGSSSLHHPSLVHVYPKFTLFATNRKELIGFRHLTKQQQHRALRDPSLLMAWNICKNMIHLQLKKICDSSFPSFKDE